MFNFKRSITLVVQTGRQIYTITIPANVYTVLYISSFYVCKRITVNATTSFDDGIKIRKEKLYIMYMHLPCNKLIGTQGYHNLSHPQGTQYRLQQLQGAF